jgi:hypothetical protein
VPLACCVAAYAEASLLNIVQQTKSDNKIQCQFERSMLNSPENPRLSLVKLLALGCIAGTL